MAVPCPGCGRDYDVTLFQFGRTLHCTCGTRVGLEPRRSPPPRPEGPPQFMVDAMLGRLARWLRLIGCDAAYDAQIEDGDLVRQAYLQRRVILTRDRAMLEEWRVPHALLVGPDDPLLQLRQVVEVFDLDWRARLFSRCSDCGTVLQPTDHGTLEGSVPARILVEHDELRRCVTCSKVYWPGSHTDRMRRTLEEALAG